MTRGGALGAASALLLVLTACGADGSTSPPPSPSAPRSEASSSAPDPTEPSPSEADPGFSTWPRGERVLPLRPDGYGVVRPTPPSLRERRYPTDDVLDPPADGRFAASIGPVTPQVRRRMGESWSPACPVALADLRYLTVVFRGFDGAAHTGELVVAASAADDLVSVFRALFAQDFPIEEMRLVTTADLDAPPTGDGNNTAGLVCRPSTGSQTTWSAHAYGLAIDLNPFQNPYEKGDLVLPERAGSYLDRTRERPGMVLADSPAVREFARIGWSWGGAWRTLKDYQHFSATGR